MPQGRRKVPFSNKQKKIQLQEKRKKKAVVENLPTTTVVSKLEGQSHFFDEVKAINAQPTSFSRNKNVNRYQLIFKKETNEEVEANKAHSYVPFEPVPEQSLEVSYEDVFKPGTELDMPKRPPWDFSLSKDILEMREQRYFREYINNLEASFGNEEISHFEMNLETWRQLWRVVEFSDIILQVTDIRFPVYQFSPALYNYVTGDLKKDMILVLNKIDLVPAPLVLAWLEYFKKQFPKLKVMCFASYAGMILKPGKRGRMIGNLHMAIVGAKQLLALCENIVGNKVDLSSWKGKIDKEASEIGTGGDTFIDDGDSDSDGNAEGGRKGRNFHIDIVENDTSFYEGEKYKDGVLTIGFVGQPNVGKSSFLNAICGKKLVSVSRTPGHTKHFQTIMLTKNIRLCDCPGLVFPSLVSKPIQVLMGCYPIAQLREPYSAVKFLGQRLKLQNIFNLSHLDIDSFDSKEAVEWSSYDICAAFAEKKGYYTAKAARPDVHRAANQILRMALDGRTVCLAFYPPNYTQEKTMWSNHPRLQDIIAIQSYRKKDEGAAKHQECEFSALGASTEEDSDESHSDSEEDDSDEEHSIPPTSVTRNKFKFLGDDENC